MATGVTGPAEVAGASAVESLSAWVARASVGELLRASRLCLEELRTRGVLRTANAPAGDYAEYLVARAYDGELAPNSEKSWDVRASDGRTLQVKCRVGGSLRKSAVFSPFRSFGFDAAVLVLLDGDDMGVLQAFEVPSDIIQRSTRFSSHVNGHLLRAGSLATLSEGAIDVTAKLRAAAFSTPE